MNMNSKERPQPPKPGKALFGNLFEGLPYDQTMKLLSEGIKAAITNCRRLLDDVEVLLAAKSYASARFLLATADEEMAKPYILLDMCRLDFSKHLGTLRNLCRAFFDHAAKHAYNEIIRFGLPLNDMKRIKEIWLTDITRWWPSDYESGEPDMPHDTYFEWELPLYVDYVAYDGRWHVPDNSSAEWIWPQPLLSH
jgi:AbiV family abortive infection protein